MIAAFLYKNPRLLLLTIAVITASGMTSLFVMPRIEDPVLSKRVALASTAFPGANARRVESLVSIPLEESLRGIAKIKQVRSNSQTGISNIVIELEDEVEDVDPIWTLVRDRISQTKEDLPESCLPTDFEVVSLKAFAAIIAVRWNEGDRNVAIQRRLARQLRSALISIEGTERVDLFGDSGEEYVAEIEPTMLASLGTTTVAVASQIIGNRTDQPAGTLLGNKSSLPLAFEANSMPVDSIADASISYGPQGDTTPLSRIADIRRRAVQPATSLALIDGQSAIVLGALVDDQQQVDRWADQMNRVVADFQNRYSRELVVETIFSQREHIDQRMLDLLRSLAIGTGAVMLIVLMLMGWRSMIVVATALPLSALMVAASMRALGIPIHQMSVTGLIVALGLLIDNAIVMVEEVRIRIIGDAKPIDAIVGGVRHLAMPLFGSTLTTTLAFLPIATLPGPPGEFVGTIAINVILAISASFLLSISVIPALISLLRIVPSQRGWFTYGISSALFGKFYEFTLRMLFRVPIVGVALGLILPGMGFLAIGQLPEQFFPPSDRSQIQIEVEMPARDTLQNTRTTALAIEDIVAANDSVLAQHWFIGGSAPTFYYNVVPRRRLTPFYAQAFVDMRSGTDLGLLVRQLQSDIDRQVPQSRIVVRQLEQGPPFDAPIEVRVIGPDLATLQQIGSKLRLLLGQTSHVIHTRSDLEESIPQLNLAVDGRAAKSLGLDKSQIATQLYTSLAGASGGKISEGDEEIPVVVKLALEGPFMLDRLAALPLQSLTRRAPSGARPGGNQPPNQPALRQTTLASLAELNLNADVGAIVRIDGRRVNEVKAYIQAGVLPSTVVEEFNQKLAASKVMLPAGYSIEFGGEKEQRTAAVNRLIANGVVLFALMLLTIVAIFRSFRCALIISVVGGLSAGLGPLALSWFGYPFGFMAIVGTMGLVGVAINDSIVVLAAIRASDAREGQVDSLVAVVVGCTRHIITTTLTTIVGFLPLILGGGGFWPPLAITIAGGVAGATFLALYVVPSLYLMLVRPTRAGRIADSSQLVELHAQPS